MLDAEIINLNVGHVKKIRVLDSVFNEYAPYLCRISIMTAKLGLFYKKIASLYASHPLATNENSSLHTLFAFIFYSLLKHYQTTFTPCFI